MRTVFLLLNVFGVRPLSTCFLFGHFAKIMICDGPIEMKLHKMGENSQEMLKISIADYASVNHKHYHFFKLFNSKIYKKWIILHRSSSFCRHLDAGIDIIDEKQLIVRGNWGKTRDFHGIQEENRLFVDRSNLSNPEHSFSVPFL